MATLWTKDFEDSSLADITVSSGSLAIATTPVFAGTKSVRMATIADWNTIEPTGIVSGAGNDLKLTFYLYPKSSNAQKRLYVYFADGGSNAIYVDFHLIPGAGAANTLSYDMGAGVVAVDPNSGLSTDMPLDIWYRVTITLAGTAVTMEVQRQDDLRYLDNYTEGWANWNASQVNVINATTALTGLDRWQMQGYILSGSGEWYLDDILTEGTAPSSPLDPGVISANVTGSKKFSANGTAATGVGTVAYQWHKAYTPGFTAGGGNAIGGATSQNLSLQSGEDPTSEPDVYLQRVATDDNGSDVSNELHLALLPALDPGTIQDGGGALWNSADVDSLTAASNGYGTITYQLSRRLFGVGSFVDVSGLTGVDPAADTTVNGGGSGVAYGYRRTATDAEGTAVSTPEIEIDVPAAPSGTFTVNLSTVPANHAGNFEIEMTGIGTTWLTAADPTKTGAGGLVIESFVVNSDTSITLTVHTTGSTGTATADAGDGTGYTVNISVAAASVSYSPSTGTAGQTTHVVVTGANMVFLQETPTGLFVPDGSAVVSTPVANNDNSFEFDLDDAVAELVTVTEQATGKSDAVTFNSASVDPTYVFVTPTYLLNDLKAFAVSVLGQIWNATLGAYENYASGNWTDYFISVAQPISGVRFVQIEADAVADIGSLLVFKDVAHNETDAPPLMAFDNVVPAAGGSGGGLTTTEHDALLRVDSRVTGAVATASNLATAQTAIAALSTKIGTPAGVSVSAALAALAAVIAELQGALQDADVDMATNGLSATLSVYKSGLAHTGGNLLYTEALTRAARTDPWSFDRA